MIKNKINKHIEIVCTSNKQLSSMSRESRGAILAVLKQHYQKVGITIVNNLADLEALAALKPDLVFLGMKFLPVDPALGLQDTNRIWISDYLDSQGITYTGSGQMAHELELNKPLAKQRALDAGLATSPFYVALQNQLQVRGDMSLTFPLFVKPANRGGGLGVDSYSVAHNFDQLESKVASITTNHQSDSLVEEYLPGREFSVAILKDEDSAEFSLMPIELIAEADSRGSRMLSEAVKESNTERVVEVSDENIRTKVTALAIDVFHALGARDYGRIDVRLNEFGKPQFLEANLLPSLISGYGSFPKACMLNINLDYEPMILSIVRLALSRNVDMADDELSQTDLALPAPAPAFGL